MSSISAYIGKKLKSNTALNTLVGGRIYLNVMPQGKQLPSVVINIISNIPTNTKSGVSTLDQIRVQITCMAQTTGTYDGQLKVEEIAEAVRTAFDYTSGTLEGVTVERTAFQNQNSAFDSSAGQDGVYLVYQDYYIYQKRI